MWATRRVKRGVRIDHDRFLITLTEVPIREGSDGCVFKIYWIKGRIYNFKRKKYHEEPKLGWYDSIEGCK